MLFENRPNTWTSILPAPNALRKSTPQFRRVNSMNAVYVSSFSLKIRRWFLKWFFYKILKYRPKTRCDLWFNLYQNCSLIHEIHRIFEWSQLHFVEVVSEIIRTGISFRIILLTKIIWHRVTFNRIPYMTI